MFKPRLWTFQIRQIQRLIPKIGNFIQVFILVSHYSYVKATLSLALASVAVFSLIFAIAPQAFAESDDSSKTYKKYWVISIGEKSGTIEITESSDIEKLKEQAISMEEATAGYENVKKTRLSQAVNDSGQYFLVWKVVTISDDGEDSTFTKMYWTQEMVNFLPQLQKKEEVVDTKNQGPLALENKPRNFFQKR